MAGAPVLSEEELGRMSEATTLAYCRVAGELSEIHKKHGLEFALEILQGTIRGAVDWAHLNVGPIAAHDLVQQVASEKWRQMTAAKKNAGVVNG